MKSQDALKVLREGEGERRCANPGAVLKVPISSAHTVFLLDLVGEEW
jgi:hypothetical protein